ncbi:MAG: glycosyltransferase family 4 protein [Gammaproteobacteria bacterium]
MIKISTAKRIINNLKNRNYLKIKLTHYYYKLSLTLKSLFFSNTIKLKIYESKVYEHLVSNYHKKPILLFSHDLTRTGAPMVLLAIAKILANQYKLNIILLTLTSGELEPEFSKVCRIICLEQPAHTHIFEHKILKSLLNILHSYNIQNAILSTFAGALLIPYLESKNFHYVILNHELPETILSLSWDQSAIPNLKILSQHNHLVFSNEYAYEQFIKQFSSLKSKCILPQGCVVDHKHVNRIQASQKLRQLLFLPENAKIILGAGKGFKRKGIDFFHDIAQKMCEHNSNIYFVWLGDTNGHEMQALLNDNISNHIIFKNFEKYYMIYMAGADLFILPSREDSLPNVAIEALACGTPVLAFDDCGGIPEWLNKINAKLVVKKHDIDDFIHKIDWLLNDKKAYDEISKQAPELIQNNFNYQTYVTRLLELININPLTLPIKISDVVEENIFDFDPLNQDDLNNSKVIAFISTNAWAVEGGGSEVLWYESAINLKKLGYDICVVLDNKELLINKLENLAKIGVKVFYNNEWGFQNLLNFNPKLIVFSQGYQNEGFDWFNFCNAHHLNYVIVNQLTHEAVWLDEAGNNLLKTAYANAHTTFFTCDKNKNFFEKQIKYKLHNAEQHYNPVPIEDKSCAPYPSTDNGYHLACPARYAICHKGQDLLLEVLNLAKWKERDLYINFYGDGPHLNQLIELKEFYNLKNLKFNAHKTSMKEIWSHNHAYISTSRMEGIPIVTLHAMHSARLPIVTDVGGHIEILKDNDSAFIAKSPSVSMIDEALERAWQERANWEELGVAAKKAYHNFMPDDPVAHFSNKLIDIYNSFDNERQ